MIRAKTAVLRSTAGNTATRTAVLITAGALLLWFILNLCILSSYPALHSDEAWLSGLSMEMIRQGRADVTEPFFDLYPRYPHALKLIYHLLQLPFLLIGGYTLFSSRILSLICGVLCLPLFYGLLRDLEGRRKEAAAGSGSVSDTGRAPGATAAWAPTAAQSAAPGAALCLALDIQFLTAAHTGRQEILLLLVEILILRLYLRIRGRVSALLCGLTVGLAAGIHPNAFILAWPPALLLLWDLAARRRRPGEGLLFLAGGVLGAGFFAGLSFLFNPNFIRDYLSYGEPLGVTRGTDEKILQLPRFLDSLFRRRSGTYFLPDIRFQMILFPLLLILPLFAGLNRGIRAARRRFKDRRDGGAEDRVKGLMARAGTINLRLRGRAPQDRMILAGTIGILTGIVLIGKYSPPSILFLNPFLYMGLHRLLCSIPAGRRILLWLPAALILLGFSLAGIAGELLPREEKESAAVFTRRMKEALPGEEAVLAGLGAAYAMDHGRFYDYRNLSFLEDEGLTVEEYVRERKIRWIVFTEELDMIYESRPVWNVLYGNPSSWYPQLRSFCEQSCRLADEFESPSYGVRVQAFRYRRPWKIRVYRVLYKADADRAE